MTSGFGLKADMSDADLAVSALRHERTPEKDSFPARSMPGVRGTLHPAAAVGRPLSDGVWESKLFGGSTQIAPAIIQGKR